VEAGQEHISYGKGAVVLNAVAKEMGREAFHNVLTEFFAAYQGTERYPTSMEFIAILRKHASDRQWETISTLLGV
jgi:aminopeptidase N